MRNPTLSFLNQTRQRATSCVLIAATLALSTTLTGCGEADLKQRTNKTQVTSAQWMAGPGSAHANHLVAKGTAPANQEVTILNPGTKAVVGKARASASGVWTLNATLSTAPCEVIANAAGSAATAAAAAAATKVVGAADSCISTFANRTSTARLIQANAVVAPNSPAPNGVIVSPAAPIAQPGAASPAAIRITTNSTLSFSAIGTDPSGNTPLSFFWDFNGAATNSNIQNPGNVKFTKPGIYYVRLTVSNSLGIPDQTPSERVISVRNPPGFNTLAAPLTAAIVSPASNVTIAQGGVVNFAAIANGGSSIYKFDWNFGGAAPNSSTQSPGLITFTKAGTFPVRLTVTDTSNPAQRNTTPLEVTVTVSNTLAGGNQPPTGIIRSPKADVTIVTGDKVFFQGAANDTDNSVIFYNWDFGGAVAAPGQASAQNPGLVQFDLAPNEPIKTFKVKMVARDAAGALDPNPPVRTITVQSVRLAAAHMPVVDIIDPATDITVDIGATVPFEATATSPDGNPLTHLWTFDGVAPDYTTDLLPPDVVFDTAGVFVVTYTATDTVNAEVATVTRLITVVDPAAAPPADPLPPDPAPAPVPLTATITQPSDTRTITAGETVKFRGAYEPDNVEVTFAWDFPGGEPATSIEERPDPVVFAEPGEYTVSFVVTDVDGNASEPATVNIIVEADTPPPADAVPADPAAPPADPAVPVVDPAAPIAVIDSPAADMTITVGDTVDFAGTGTDPNELALTYEWIFGPDLPGSTLQNPGAVTFTAVGVVNVEFLVTNADGLVGSATVVMTVQDVPAAPAQAVPVAPARRTR